MVWKAEQSLETIRIVECQNDCLLRTNDHAIKSWIRTCLPFEYHPGWKVFLTMLSGEISLGKRFMLG